MASADSRTPYTSAPVPCGGCGRRIPYETADPVDPAVDRAATSYGEWLSTPLGLTFVRTCWDRTCVLEARRVRDGKRTTPPEPRDVRDQRRAREAAEALT